jgi:phosphatidylinositol 4-kinase
MQRVYCVLAGTTLWDYDTEDEAALRQRPRSEVDVIGVSPWDGKARYQNYVFGFLFLSTQGTTYYAVAHSKEDLEYWLSAVRVGLQVRFGMRNVTSETFIKISQKEVEDGEDEDEVEEEEEEEEKEMRRTVGRAHVHDEGRRKQTEDGEYNSDHGCPDGICEKGVEMKDADDGMERVGEGRNQAKIYEGTSPRNECNLLDGMPLAGVTGVQVDSRRHCEVSRPDTAVSAGGIPTSGIPGPSTTSSRTRKGMADKPMRRTPYPSALPERSDASDVVTGGECRQDSDTCGISGQPLGRSNPRHSCLSCAGSFSSEYCSDEVPLLHFQYQQAVRVCRNCFLAQYFLNHLKLLSATLRTHLYELALEGCPVADKNSAKNRVFRRPSAEALLAWQLYDGGQIDAKEFSELLKADARLQDERVNSMLGDFKVTLMQPGVGDDAITLLRLLFDLRDEGQPVKYALILERLLLIARSDLAAVEFVLPQLLQIYVLKSDDGGVNQILQLEALEDFLVKICCVCSAQIPLRVVWSMMGYYEDTLHTNAPPWLMARRGRIIRLTLRIEAAIRGAAHEFSVEMLNIFSLAAPAQLALLRREWAIVQETRQHPLLRPFPPMTTFRKMHGEIGDDPSAAALAVAESSRAFDSSFCGQRSRKAQGAGPPSAGLGDKESTGNFEDLIAFTAQINLVKSLTDTAESLRHIDPSLRKETLRASLQRIQHHYRGVYFPLSRDLESMPGIIRLCVDEGVVFRSKARVPILVCFEVIRLAQHPKRGSTLGEKGKVEAGSNGQTARRSSTSAEYMSKQEAEHLLDKGALHERMSSLELGAVCHQSGGQAKLEAGGSASEAREEVDQASYLARNAAIRAKSNLHLDNVPYTVAPNAMQRYASKSEVLQMVQTRRRRTRVDVLELTTNEAFQHFSGEHDQSSSTAASNSNHIFHLHNERCTVEQGMRVEDVCVGTTGGADAKMTSEVSPAVATAIQEFKKGNLTKAEFDMLVAKDQRFRRNISENSYLDDQFFVSMAFGESWASKRARVKAASPDGNRSGWDLLSMIVKSNDDLRQEVCMVQFIEMCQVIFREAGLDLWLEPYGIISTTSSTGLIETLTDALSLDALKKKDGYISLAHHFQSSYGHDAARLLQAKHSFVTSLAAYSLVCYVFQIKDRHNGNILLDTEGHLIHIDYGFILGIAPGGSFSIETAPFKLTPEMVEVMGGVDGALFDEFAALFAGGFFALQLNVERIMALVEIMAEQSRYPCFQATDRSVILQRLRARLLPGGRLPVSKVDTVAFALDLITQSYNSITTLQYERYQNFTNGISI